MGGGCEEVWVVEVVLLTFEVGLCCFVARRNDCGFPKDGIQHLVFGYWIRSIQDSVKHTLYEHSLGLSNIIYSSLHVL